MAASALEDDPDGGFIAREIATTLNVLSLQANVLKESPEAAVLSAASSSASSKSKGPPAVSIEVQRLEWLPEARTLRLSAYPEVNVTSSSLLTTTTTSRSNGSSSSTGGDMAQLQLTRAQQLLLAAPLEVELFFPESPRDPPLCFGSTDAAALVAERVNGSILPLERSSLLHAVSRIVTIIRQEVDSIWPPTGHDYLLHFRTRLAAHLRRHPRAADLLLSLLSMARPHQNPSVRFPLPRFFYRGAPGKDAVDQPAVMAALAAVPPLPTLARTADGSSSPLPFPSCVLLHHLFFRSRVALLDPPNSSPSPLHTPTPTANDDDAEVHRLLHAAGILALPPSEQPALVFRLAHGADARFLQPARRHGTRVGFHGSPPGNFFSIVALGLRNLSGTRGMRNGAAFGEGVYLASHLSVAREFGDWGTKVWAHSSFGVPPPSAGADLGTAAPPVFAYQVIALCEFLALDKYTKRLVPSSSSGTAPAASAASTTPVRARAGGKKADSEYYVVEEDQHLVVRLLLLFKDPAILRHNNAAGGSAAIATTTTTATTAVSPSPTAARPTATEGAAGAGAAGAAAAVVRRPRRRKGWGDHLLMIVRGVLCIVALVLLLDGLEKLLVKKGLLRHPSTAAGGRRRRGAGQ